ncbi:hypothetical protein ACLB9X_32520 [Streptomyces sp. 5K101]|uniref:hypothetical protein n=1 Tax=Streptomyces sp. 5K101 TaxID=3390037 RepID=UPI00397721CC
MTTTEPNPPRVPEPDPRQELRKLWVATGLLALCGLAYVLHQHPALRETAAAVGGLGGLVALVLSVRRRG